MRFSLELVPKISIEELVAIASNAESMGFDTIWVSDHYNHRNVSIVLFALASKTRSIKIGPGILNPYILHPAYIAQILATLSECAKNRIVCGIGAGDLTMLRQLGIERVGALKKVELTVKIIRDLLSGKDVRMNYDSKMLYLTKLDINTPVSIPIYLGAQGEKMLKLASLIADGVLVNASDLDLLRSSYKIVTSCLNERGIDQKHFDIAAHISLSVDDDLKVARRVAAIYAAYILAGASDTVLNRLGIDIECATKIRDALLKLNTQEAKDIVDPYIEKFIMVVKPNRLREAIEEVASIGYNHIVLGPPFGKDLMGVLKLIMNFNLLKSE